MSAPRGSAVCPCGLEITYRYRLDGEPGAPTTTACRCPKCDRYLDLPIPVGAYFIEIEGSPSRSSSFTYRDVLWRLDEINGVAPSCKHAGAKAKVLPFRKVG
jgi:hypothetical protein